MIEWLLLLYVGTADDFEVWGGYQTQSACERTVAILETRYQKKRQTFSARCQPVMAVQLEPMISKH